MSAIGKMTTASPQLDAELCAAQSEPPTRIRYLDFLRGVAVLGMLVANIPWHAGDSMSRVHDPDTLSAAAWLIQYLLFDQRFLPIFCMLFGAGVLLMAERSESVQAFRVRHLKRMAALLVIGIAHAYLLWPGDILITYAVCGPFLLFFLNVSALRLIALGVVLKAINLVFNQWPAVYDATVFRLLFSWWVDYGEPPSTIVQAYAGSYADLFAYNAWRNQFLQWTALPYFRIWNAFGFMLIGMAIFRLGILQGERSTRFYRRLALWTLAISAPLVIYGTLARIGVNETVGPFLGFTQELGLRGVTFLSGCAIGSVFVLAASQLIYRRSNDRLHRPIEAVGRMALTNYVMHSLLFFVYFHVIKAAPFDSLDHDVLLLMTVCVWILQVGFSCLWLSRFQQGPLEGLWRRLSGA